MTKLLSDVTVSRHSHGRDGRRVTPR